MKSIEIDFAKYNQSMKQGSGGRSLLLKAVGLTKSKNLRILDATAGLMRDAFFMAKFGGDVTAIERSSVLAKMITEAMINHLSPHGKSRESEASEGEGDISISLPLSDIAECHSEISISPVRGEAKTFKFIQGNAIDLIPTLPPFDVIYLDPMFREEKSAKAKKDLQFLQALHHNEIDDSIELFAVARQYAKLRVVVKRSLHAPYLAELKPDWSYPGKSIRFDVYASNSLA